MKEQTKKRLVEIYYQLSHAPSGTLVQLEDPINWSEDYLLYMLEENTAHQNEQLLQKKLSAEDADELIQELQVELRDEKHERADAEGREQAWKQQFFAEKGMASWANKLPDAPPSEYPRIALEKINALADKLQTAWVRDELPLGALTSCAGLLTIVLAFTGHGFLFTLLLATTIMGTYAFFKD